MPVHMRSCVCVHNINLIFSSHFLSSNKARFFKKLPRCIWRRSADLHGGTYRAMAYISRMLERTQKNAPIDTSREDQLKTAYWVMTCNSRMTEQKNSRL